ncbi:MAG: glutaminyl-peptide cyclotransferase, partial [Gaiellaceae bacterium]|nr:glutaminyl-peptide cyclotransferase [Gaiellaceae bacterium]
MAAVPPRPRRRRARHGSLERPVSGRTYRGTWLLVALPLLVAAFSVTRPQPLQKPVLAPDFDAGAAKALGLDLSQKYPDRRPGSAGALGAAQWFRDQITQYGLVTATQPFTADVPGEGRLAFQNLVVVVGGRSPQRIVIMAHRDDLGIGPGANDNASGTAALIELARPYTTVASPGTKPVEPAHTLVFLSTDGGAFGAQGARAFLRSSVYAEDVVAVINLDSIAGRDRARLVIAGDEPRSPAPALVVTAAARIVDQSGVQARRPSALRQLVDLGFPFSLYEQAPFVARGIPAVTLTTAGDRPPASFSDRVGQLRAGSIGILGGSAQDLLGSLDQGLELAHGTTSYVFLGSRIIRGWALELVLVSMLLPFLAGAVDLF